MADPIVPIPGINSSVIDGGTSVVVVLGGTQGGVITNPSAATDQGLANVETLYVNPIEPAVLNGNGTTFALAPGQSWEVFPGQTNTTYVNAKSSGHRFSVYSLVEPSEVIIGPTLDLTDPANLPFVPALLTGI